MRFDIHDQCELASLRRANQALRREWIGLRRDLLIGKYSPSQPRLPAGQPGGGRWVGNDPSGFVDTSVSAGDIGMSEATQALRDALSAGVSSLGDGTQTAFLQTLPAGVAAMGEALTMGLALFEYMSRQNGPDSQAILSFNAREYYPATQLGLGLEFVRQLDREETQVYCPRLPQVQDMTDFFAVDVKRRLPDLSPQQYGNEVHLQLRDWIRAQDDNKFHAEISVLKGVMDDKLYGAAGSIRIDAIENVDTETVCIYDIKTGRAGLAPGRAFELAREAYSVSKSVRRIIVTEVRPKI